MKTIMNIYTPQGRAREYSPLALNYFKGCTHGCKYCYVPPMMKRFRSGYNHDECISPKEIDFASLEKSAKKFQGCDKQILLSFTGDPYSEVDCNSTTKVLEILNRYNHKVAILTKGGHRALNDFELIKSFGDRIKVGATLTFDNDKDSLDWEPGAALPDERIDTLRAFSDHGVKTWASFEPVIIPNQSLNLITKISSFIDHVRIGKLNNYKGLDKDVDWGGFLCKAVSICRATGIPFYIKEDLRAHNNGTILHPNEIDEDFLNL